MTISVKKMEEHTLITVSGSLDTAMIFPLQPFFDTLIEQIDQKVVVDLSQTTRIDRSGIGLMVFLFKRLRMKGYHLELIGVHGQALSTLVNSMVDKTMNIVQLTEMKKKLIVFGEDWGRFPSSTQHLIIGLLHLKWEIIWINSIGMRKPTLSRAYFERLYGKLCQYLQVKKKKPKQQVPRNLHIVNPMVIPFYGIALVDKLNRFFLGKQVGRLINKKKFNNAIIWTSLPTAYPYLKLFKNCPILYYCGDEFSVFNGIEPNKIITLEKKTIDAARLIIVSSPVLAQKMPAEKTVLLDHGVNFSAFQKHYPRPIDLPKKKPIAGFFGSIANWVDIDLMITCAKRLPSWNFVFIGPKTIDISQLLKLKNVFYLGSKPYEKIPAYAEHWDVCLLPFIINPHTLACNPMQLKEYLACGKPVVAIELPVLEAFRAHIHLAKNADEFIHAIELAKDDKAHEIRKGAVENLSWDKKAASLEQTILGLL